MVDNLVTYQRLLSNPSVQLFAFVECISDVVPIMTVPYPAKMTICSPKIIVLLDVLFENGAERWGVEGV